MSVQDFIPVLQALMSVNNQERMSAEAFFSAQLEGNPIATIQVLLALLADGTSAVPVLRSFAGVLLRRAVEKNKGTFTPDVLGQLRQSLIQIWCSENDLSILKRLAHVLAQSASNSAWPDLLPSVINHCNTSIQGITSAETVAERVLPVLMLIEIVAEYCPDDVMTHLPHLGAFLGTHLSSSLSTVQVACAKAIGSCIVALEDDTARSQFKPALQPIISVLCAALSRGDEDDAQSIMQNLVVIAQLQPVFFKGAMDGVVGAMLQVAQSEDLDFPTRSIALELMVTLTETAPALARKCAGLVQGLVPLAMSIMLEVEEEEDEWVRGKYEQEPEDENCFVGEEAIERAASGMGGRTLGPVVFAAVQEYGASADKNHRRAAVAGLYRLACGSEKTFKPYMNDASAFLASALSDASQRVRYQAVEALGLFALTFPQNLPSLVDQFVPMLTNMLTDTTLCPRLSGHTVSALINLTNPASCPSEVLEKHLEPLLRALVGSLQSAPVEVQPHLLDLLACVSRVSDQAFAPYYASFMPGVKNILRSALSPELSKLRGKAMECAGHMGEAVGPEVFAADASEVMQILLGAMSNDAQNDITFDYVLPACARIANALGPAFEPFLSVVMAPLLQGAMTEVQCQIVDANDDDEDEEEGEDEETGLVSHVFDMGKGMRKKVTLNTHAVMQQKRSTDLLLEIVGALKGHLKGFLVPVLQALLPLLTTTHSTDTRASAALALAKTFEAFVDARKQGFCQQADLDAALTTSITKLLFVLKGESNSTSRACAGDALVDVLKACYYSGEENVDGVHSNPLTLPDMESSDQMIRELLIRCQEGVARRTERESAFTANEGLEEEDKENFNQEQEEEDELLQSLAESMGLLLKLHGEPFMPLFDQLIAPIFAPLLDPAQPAPLQIVAICLIDDAIEFGGASAFKYIAPALGKFVENLAPTQTHLVLRQCSVYGIAQVARVAPEIFSQHLGAIVPALLAITSHPDAKEEDNEGITENALYALGTVCTHPHYRTAGMSGTDLQSISQVWLQGLPLKADEHEAMCSTARLCDSIEAGDEVIMGADSANLPQILRIIADVFLLLMQGQANDTLCNFSPAHPDTIMRMQTIIKHFAGGAAGAVAQSLTQQTFSSLSQKQQEALQKAML